ncbi:MAG: site-2 protease family protein [Anaerolineae bacterium]|nr:site-2 protease family protein [Anaerolineae bacterium]
MSDNGNELSTGKTPLAFLHRADYSDDLRKAVEEVMTIDDITLKDGAEPTRYRGHLNRPAHEAFALLRPRFEAMGHTPQMRREDGVDVIRALNIVYSKETNNRNRLAILLLVTTILSVFFVGLQGELYVSAFEVVAARLGYSDFVSNPNLLPTTAEWHAALLNGLWYMLALLGILGAHEMGHYLMARRHKVNTTMPFFIPLPIHILGTLGAVIAMREPAPNRRVQFDIGIAGPLAGLIVAVPVMLVGLGLSQIATADEILADVPEEVQIGIIHEGNSLAYLGLKYAVFGEILPNGDRDVWVHPVAFAAWAGFLVTALNLFPIGQLDGGHVMYGLFGEKAAVARWPIIGVLTISAVAGTLADLGIVDLGIGWSGWWLLILMMIFLFKRHAPVLDEITELDPRRKALGVLMLVVFVLIFTPRPLVADAAPIAEAVIGWLV